MKTKLFYAGALALCVIALVACAAPTPVPTPTAASNASAILTATAPIPPTLTPSGAYDSGSIRVGDLDRRYSYYVPANLPRNAPLLLVLHGSSMNIGNMRQTTGYEFENLADQLGLQETLRLDATPVPAAMDYRAIPFALTLRGSYTATVRYLVALRSLPLVTNLTTITMTSSNQTSLPATAGGTAVVEAQLTGNAYQYLSAAPQP